MSESLRVFEYLKSRGVKEILHFTDVNNLESIAENGILPRDLLDQLNIPYVSNDVVRLDGKGHINLSISNLNNSMFYKFRKTYPHHCYVILSLDISLLKDLSSTDYYFTSTNAASSKAQVINVEEMFDGWRGKLPIHFPTDNQSEVIIKTKINSKYINFIYVEDQYDQNLIRKINKFFPTKQLLIGTIKFKYSKALVDKDTVEGLEEIEFFDQKVSEILTKIHRRKQRRQLNNDSLPSGKQEAIEQYETESLINEIYLSNWFATDSQMIQVEKLFLENKSTVIFDTYALPGNYFEDKKYDKSTTRKDTYWQIQYSASPFDQTQPRTSNQLSALAVLEKIINRGRMTKLSNSLEQIIRKHVQTNELYSIIRYVHQVQSTLVELVKNQKLSAGDKIKIENLDKSVARAVFTDLIELDFQISKMYKVVPFFLNIDLSENEGNLVLSNNNFGENVVSIVSCPKPKDFTRDFIRVQETVDVEIDKEILSYLLNYIFGFNEFRPNQIDGIVRALRRQDAIVLLPTGSGKSIVYQLLSLITPGVSFIVDPIVSLAYDQVDNLYRKGIDRVTELVSDTENKKQVEIDIGRGQYFMSFVSPERFQNQSFRDKIQYYARTNIISLIAIDEAHCVSEWGHDFRTAYLSLAQTCRTICTTLGGSPPPLLALTGTASASVLRDMQRDLNILEEDAIIQPESFDRKEIEFRVVNCDSKAKEKALQDILVHKIPEYFNRPFEDFYKVNGIDTSCGLVFCTVAGEDEWSNGKFHPFGTRNIQALLNTWLPEKTCGVYNGKLQSDVKKENARKFKNNELIALSATKSYGMGIDKPNIRWAVHFGISSSIEAYYQEAGRCARDGKPSVSWIILSNDYPDDNLRILDSTKISVNTLQQENNRIKGSKPWEGDDVSRIVYFHANSFSGIEREIQTTNFVLNYLLNDKCSIPFSKDTKLELEKSVYRLRLIGYVSDYTVNHFNKTLNVKLRKFSPESIETYYREYISGYQENDGYLNTQIELLKKATIGFENSSREYLLATISTLLNEFTYKIVEEGRRIAMRNMLTFTTEAAKIEDSRMGGEYLRKKILDYLSTNEKIKVNELISKATDLTELDNFFNQISSEKMASRILTQSSRLLEAYPEHFGLYYLMFRIHDKYSTRELALKTMSASLYYGVHSYGMEKDILFNHVVSLICTQSLSKSEWNSIIQIVINELGEEYAQKLLEQYESDTLKNVYLLNKLSSLSNRVIEEWMDS